MLWAFFGLTPLEAAKSVKKEHALAKIGARRGRLLPLYCPARFAQGQAMSAAKELRGKGFDKRLPSATTQKQILRRRGAP